MKNRYAYVSKSIREILLMVLKYSLTVILMGIVGVLLLMLAYSIPVNQRIKESSLLYSDSMGWAPLVNNRYTQYMSHFTSFNPGILDDATDKIILNNSFDEGEGTVLERAVNMNNYGRYWHGYVSVLRFIFYFMDYWDFLLLNSFLQLFLMGCVGYAVFKVTGKKSHLLAFFSSCAFLTPAAVGMSLQYTPCFYISMFGSLFCLLKSDWILRKNRRYFLFLLLGIVTCYFDFLTYPLLCFAFPFCWLIVAVGEKLGANRKLELLFSGGLSFVFGYGGFFVVKWFIESVVSRTDHFVNGITSVFFHVGGLDKQYQLLHQNYSRIDSLYNNFRHYFYPLFIVILSAWIILLVYKFISGKLSVTFDNIVFIAVILTGPAWYFIINTHTGIHHLFTYRIYDASILGFMLFICNAIEHEHKATRSFRSYIVRVGTLCLCLALGACASRLAKEDIGLLNGGDYAEVQISEVQISEGDVFEVKFTPSLSEIKGFSFCIQTHESVAGEIHIDIYDEDIICEQLSIPIAEYKNQTYDLQLTNWKLITGKQYIMKVHITNNSDGVILLVATDGTRPQVEYGEAFINQKKTIDMVPLSGITYRGHVQSLFIKVFLSVCSGTFILTLLLAVQVLGKVIHLTNNRE